MSERTRDNRPEASQGTSGRAAVVLLLALIASAYLTAAGMESAVYAKLAWVNLLPLLYAVRVLRPAAALACGAVWGLSIQCFATLAFATSVPTSWVAYAVVTAAPAAFAFFGAMVTRGVGFHPLVLAVGWLGVELTLVALGLRNGLLSAIRESGAATTIVGHLLGYGFVGFLMALINALLVELLDGIRKSLPNPRLGPLSNKPEIRGSDASGRIGELVNLFRAMPRGPPQLRPSLSR